MSGFLNKIYLFSKLSIILILLIIILLFSYLFYKSYKNQEILSSNNIEEKNVIIDLINNNSDKIGKLNRTTVDLNKNISIIKNNIESVKNNVFNDEITTELLDLSNKIKILNSEILKMQKKSSNDKIVAKNSLKNNLNIKKENEVVNFIKLKFENGKNFSSEIDLLNQIAGPQIQYLIEKLNILNNEDFKGSEILFLNFQSESNVYISEKFFSKNNLVKGLLPYINIQPSEINDIENKDLMKIKKINNFIIKKNYADAIILLESIDKENNYFKQTLNQLNIGKSFNLTIKDILQNG